MNIDQLTEGLDQAFTSEGHRIVFWYDPDGDFVNELGGLGLSSVQIISMKDESALAVKLKLELEDTSGKYLLYFPSAEPEIEKDWLLDIKLYSRCFYADRFSIIFSELGLQQQSVREHLVARSRFLASKARLDTLKKWVQPNFNEAEIDLAMVATVVKAESCDLPRILFAIAEEVADEDLGLEAAPASISELEKYGLLPALISSLQDELGYLVSPAERNGEEALNFGQFLIRLLTTGFCESISFVPEWAANIAMPSENANATSRALLSRWRDSSRYYRAYDTISAWVASALRLSEKLNEIPIETLAQVATFQDIDQKIAVELAGAIPDADPKSLSVFAAIIADRMDNYWASRHKDDDRRRRYRTVYSALNSAISFFSLQDSHSTGFHYKSSADIYFAYETELYKFDTYYRQYFTASLKAHVDILKGLDARVEQCYSGWYLDNLAKNWGDCVESEESLANWRIPGRNNQHSFYDSEVLPGLSKGNKRLVVIISDAFRYEAAVELRDRINEKRYNEASLSSQVGVVPSYTALGMASLLPHKTLEYKEAAGDDVFVDGKSSKGTAARNKILADYGGIAITADQVKAWSRDEGREALKDQQLVYIYHNIVDARGDSASTESGTFPAVEEAIEELAEISRKVLMHFNTSNLLITADHGFLFQQSKPEQADRTSMVDKPSNAIKNKKRYVIGFDLPEATDVWSGSTKNTAGTTSDTQFWIPKGANRFHFVGGARFVHGGIMPQEIVVPILKVKQLRGEKAEQRSKRKVGVISPKSSLRMVNSIQKFELMQTEAISEQILPVTAQVAIYDGDKIISSEEIVSFDSSSDSFSERSKQVRLSLSGSGFDRNRDYFLVIKDKDLRTEIERYRISIDLAFTDDFL